MSNTGYGQDKGQAEAINPPLSERTPQIRAAIVAAVPGVNSADDVTAAHLAAITTLNPAFRGITSLKSGDFKGLTALTHLNLSGNAIGDISVLEGLTTLTSLYLAATSISDISVLENLTALKNLYLTHNSISDISVLENLTALTELSLGENSVSDISVLKDLTALKTLILDNNSIRDVSVLENLTTLKFLYLNKNPISNYGPLRRLIAAIAGIENHPGLTLDIVIPANNAPVFTAGSSTTLAVVENTASGQNIGAAVAATDADSGDPLTYSLGGTDAASFSIDDTTGQLQTSAALDYETQTSYSVIISVSDDNGGSDSITVTINITDVNENRAPVFTDGSSTTRAVAENTGSGQNIGTMVSATDADTEDTLTYTLGGADAASFSIDGTNGQLQTKATLDYETQTSYTVTITVSDTKLTDAIDVTISVTNVNEAPSFANSTATRSIAENTASGEDIGAAVVATDPDADDTLTYTLGGTDVDSFSIVNTSGQLRTHVALDHETKASYSVTVTATDGDNLSDTTTVTISVTNVNEAPSFTEGSTATRAIAENTASDTDIGSAVAATDPDTGDTLTYTLSGADAASFSINGTSGQLKTSAALDYEAKSSYSVSITVSDSELTDTIDVTINVTDVDENRAPAFAEGTSTTRAVAENTASDTNIGSAVSATDPDDDTLTYTLSGADAASFSIDGTNGQLQTKAALDYETQTSYTLTITVSDSELTDAIDVTINVTNVNEAPNFATNTATRSVAENTAANINIGDPVTATDPDSDDTVTYTLGGTDVDSFSIVNTSGQLRTHVALDHETKASYSVTVTATDSDNLSDTTTVTITVTNVNEAPNFTEGSSATRAIAENTASDTDIGAAFTATDVDANTTLTYTLGGADAASFGIDGTNGQLQTKAALDYETQTSYTVTITVSDSELTDTIDVTINVTDVDENRAPAFAEGTSTTRAVAENTAADTNIGSAVSATDPDDDTLTYTLSGTDAESFSIDGTNGQLQTKAALDYEAKSSYSVTITVSDSKLTDTIDVTINVTDVNENRAPEFTAGSSTTLSIAENTAAGENIGSPVAATDVDTGNTLTYTLGGIDASSFSIVRTNGQLKTDAALDYETKTSYSVTVSVSDGNGSSDSIDVTITVTNVNEAPNFATTTATRSVAENTAANINIGAAFTATDVDANTTLTYTLGGADAASFSINGTNGQLQTKAALDYETQTSYTVTITVSDSELTDTIDVTINVTDVDENGAPAFTDGSDTTRAVAENTDSRQDIGSAVSATDPDDDTLTYTLGGADAASFGIDGTNGQLRTNAALDYEAKSSYSVTITVSDSELTDTIDVTISVTNVNEAPNFANSTATRSIVENTASGADIGAAVAATDPDSDDTVTYTLGGTDVDSFSIVNTSGQLRTHVALDYETKASYSVTVTATDGDNLSDTTTVTISVTDVNEAPNFTEGSSATRAIAENTASETNIGSAVAATDPDTGDTLTYTLGGTDAASFSIDGTNGQLQTSAALDYETQTSYTVTITVSDTELTDTIDVTINVTDVNDSYPLYGRTQQVQNEIVRRVNGVNRADNVTVAHLRAMTALYLNNKGITSLKSGDFDDLTALTLLNLNGNSISDISPIAGLTKLTHLHLDNNSIRDISALEGLTKLTHLDLNNNSIRDISVLEDLTALVELNMYNNWSIRDISALEGMTRLRNLYLSGNSIKDISALEDLTALRLLYLKNNSISDISAVEGLINLTQLGLSGNPISDYRPIHRLIVAKNHSGLWVDVNVPPMFTEGTSTTRTVVENTASGQAIGDPVSAKDANGHTLTYSLGGTDAASFSIDTATGQLKTKAALNYQTKTSYSVTVSVGDGTGAKDSIAVTINVTDVNYAPSFTEGDTTTRAVAENTASGQDIGDAVAATDVNNDTLTYSLGGVDADAFSIDTASGQLQTAAALDYGTKTSYSVTVSVSDGREGTDSIVVTISVTDVNYAPAFTDGATTTRAVAENTASGQNIGTAVAATDKDNDTLTYSLEGADAASFSIDTATGQLQTSAALSYRTKNAYSVTVSADDGNGGTDSITVTINVTIFPVNLRTQEVQDAIVAEVSGVNNADDVTVAHLAAITSLYLNNKSITSLKSSDFNGLTGLTNLYLAGNSLSDISMLSGLTTLKELYLDNSSISDISALSGLTGLTTLYLWSNSISDISALSGLTALEYLYLESNSISDISALEGLTALIDLRLSYNPISDYDPLRRLLAAIDGIEGHRGLTLDINIPPAFTEGTSTTRAVAEYTPPGKAIGDPVSATDADSDSVTYSLGGTDPSAFKIDTASGQLQTRAALNYETKSSYSVTVSASDAEGGTDSIDVTINVTDVNEELITAVNQRTQGVQNAIVAAVPGVANADDVTPAHLGAITSLDIAYAEITSLKPGDFSGLSTLTELDLSVNSISNISPLSGLSTLTALNLAGNPISDISALAGLTKLTDLNLSGNPISDISVLAGLTALKDLSLDGTSVSDVSALEGLTTLTGLYLWGSPISDYDPLRRLIAAIAEIEGHTGLKLDINIPPVFTEGTSTTRAVSEYTSSGQAIGDPVSATDADNDTLTYSLGGTDVDTFNIDTATGQLQTRAALDYETKTSYSVTVSVADGKGGTDSIAVTINVTDVDEELITAVDQRTQEVQDAIMEVVPVDSAEDVTVVHLGAITSLDLSDKSITSLKSGDFSGLIGLVKLDLSGNSISDVSALEGITILKQLDLQNNSISDVSALEGLTGLTHLHLSGNPISDYVPLRNLKAANPDISIDIDINNNPPQFTEGDNTTRSIAEGARLYRRIGAPISATDTDPDDRLTYSFAPDRFGGSDAAPFVVHRVSGILYTTAALDYEEQASYTVVVDVSDGRGGLDRITVTINITGGAGAAPSIETSSIVPKKTELLTNFPNPFNPETWIPYQLAEPAEVTLTIYDIRGVVVRELQLGHQPAGIYYNRSRAIHWDGRNAFGEKVATGVYFYTLKAGDFTATRKLLIRK